MTAFYLISVNMCRKYLELCYKKVMIFSYPLIHEWNNRKYFASKKKTKIDNIISKQRVFILNVFHYRLNKIPGIEKRQAVENSGLAVDIDLDFVPDTRLTESALIAALEGASAEFDAEGLQLADEDGVVVTRSFLEEDGKLCLNLLSCTREPGSPVKPTSQATDNDPANPLACNSSEYSA